ncbi:MAG TPA: recombinase family protein, partial [Ruminococcus sp.]
MNVTMIPATKQANSEVKDKYHQIRVAAYCRVSTEQEEQQNSYQTQINYYTDLINKNPEWELAGIFADEGISGTQTKKRTEFNKMIRLCKKRKIDLILCKSISRFARNTVDILDYVRQLKELGIGVLFEEQNINTLNMTSEFMIALYGSFAQAESESISKNVTWGVEKSFREGKVRFNYHNLYGYMKGEDGKPEIVPEQAKIIKHIYNLYLDGLSMKRIANQLNEMFITTKQNGKWTEGSIFSILRNEKYVGDALLQKTYTVDCITHKKARNNGERAKYLVTDAHEAIIDRDTYNLVQQELAKRSSKRKKSDKAITEQGKYSSKYALTEIMICAECGAAYRRQVWNIHGRKCPVWRCISRIDNGKRYCKKSPSIHEDKLHKAILTAINEYYDCKDSIKELLKSNVEQALLDINTKETKEIQQRLREIDEARNDYILLIASGAMDEESFDEQFQKLYD